MWPHSSSLRPSSVLLQKNLVNLTLKTSVMYLSKWFVAISNLNQGCEILANLSDHDVVNHQQVRQKVLITVLSNHYTPFVTRMDLESFADDQDIFAVFGYFHFKVNFCEKCLLGYSILKELKRTHSGINGFAKTRI